MSDHRVDKFLDTNEWVPIHSIPGFESCIEYFINEKGEVLSHKGNKPKILKCGLNMDGYPLVTLGQRIGRKKPKTVAVHKLVALAFLGKPPKPYGNKRGCVNIDHLDGNKENNHVSNLAWVDPAENTAKPGYNRGISKILANPTPAQLKHREVSRRHISKIFDDPERLAKHREYKREWMRKKRAAEKVAKIEESDT